MCEGKERKEKMERDDYLKKKGVKSEKNNELWEKAQLLYLKVDTYKMIWNLLKKGKRKHR